MSRTVRIDPEVRAALDRIRERYGDRNYSDAIRRVLRWHRIVRAESDVPDEVYRLWTGRSVAAHGTDEAPA